MLSDELAPATAEQKFETFYRLMLAKLARLVRARATGRGEAGEMALAQRLIDEAALPVWAELWETAVRQKADADALNLDRKTLILELFSSLEAAAPH
jgi:DNA polymerase-3 subunit delta'